MKVRVRSVNGGETLRLDLPPTCSLQSLKDTIADKISSIPSSIHLSLDKKDELQGVLQEPLQTLGIVGGDLIYYTLSADGFQLADNAETPKRGREEEQNPKSMRELCASAAVKRASNGEGSNSGPSRETCVNDTQVDDDPQVGVESMEVDDEQLPLLEKSRSVPFFLERVLLAERENAESGHRLLVMAVHAVMLELGFVGFDLKTSAESGFVGFDGFRLPEGWATKAMVSLYYTLPELVNGDGKCVESVCLRFQMLGSFLVVYGSLVSVKGSQVYRLSLEVEMFLSALHFAVNSMEVICDGENSLDSLITDGKKQNENTEIFSLNMRESQQVEMVVRGSSRHEMAVKGSSSSHEVGVEASSSQEMRVFELWRIVKDRLSMPVLTALCEKTGLPSPPSLILLPTELKLKVLEFLPAVDVARLGCVCTELRFLSVNDELWKKKYAAELGSFSEVDKPAEGRPDAQRWKDAFARDWIMKKRMEAQRRKCRNRSFRQTPRMRLPRYMPVPFPGMGFGISGGDYDRFPAIGDGGFFPGGGLLGSNGRRLWSTGRRHGATSCDFSGLKDMELPDQ